MITVYKPDIVQPYYPSAVDIETAPDGTLLDIGFVYTDHTDTQVYHTFPSWRAFTSFLLARLREYGKNKQMKARITRLYAHNGNGFDWLSYLRFLIDNDGITDYNVIMSEQMVIGIVLTFHTKHKVYLCDSMRLMPYSLRSIAEKLNRDHQKLYTGEYASKMHIFKAQYPDEYYAYLREDCYALSEALYRFWTKIYELEGSIGTLPLTLPSLALKVFRKRLQSDISTPWNDDVRTFTRRAYSGGRVECYKPGHYTTVNVYDVNSMYPAMMHEYEVPINARGAWTRTVDYTACGFYEITYTQTDTTIPPILRDEASGNFEYQGSGVYYAREIELFSRYGTYTVSRGYEFQHTAVLFRDFVDKYYNLRLQAKANGDAALDFIAKILMNSLYGKFGQRSTRTNIEMATNAKITEYTEKGVTFRVDNDFMIVTRDERAENEFVAIAAIITAMARVSLFGHILNNVDDYIYGDTDSVHIAGGTLPTSDGLGGLKLEKSGEGVYIGRKLYAIGDKITAKGVGRAVKTGALTKETLSRLLDKAQSENISFESFPSLRDVLHGVTPCKPITRNRRIRRTS